MATLTVGPNGSYATIASAVAAAHDGDTIQVQAGTYTNDFVHVTSRLNFVAVGGTVNMVATVAPTDGKSIMTVDADTTITGFNFSGAKVADANGAGIRYEGGNLDLENCTFHDNENGVMTAPVDGGQLTINNCLFYHNGNGNGLTHNLYVGDIDTVTITNSTFTDVVVGHEIKSRAENTIITGCTIVDGPDSTASYSIDLPNGGNAVITNNTIEKGPNAENQAIVHFGGEGIAYAGSGLTLSNNTITNDLSSHSTVLLFNQTLINATVSGNTFLGLPIPTYSTGPATLTNNKTATGPVADSDVTDISGTGNTLYITDPGDQSVVLPTSFMAVKAGAGHLTATGFSHETIVGGLGGVTWNGQDGADTIYTAAGSTNILHLGNANNGVQSVGTDTITLGRGNNGIVVQGTATLSGGTGANSISVEGTAAISDSGSDFITVGAKANVTITDTGYVALTSNGGTFSLSQQAPGQAVANTMTVQGGAASLMGPVGAQAISLAGGSKGAVITFGTGNHQIVSSAPDTIRAGSGTDVVIIGGNAQVYQGTGTLSVFGRGILGMATVHGAAGTMTLDGDTGNIRYQSEGGPATLNDKLSRTVVVGGSSLLTVNATGGQINIQGGTGGIVVNDSSGGHTITTAAGATDTLNLLGGSTVASNGTDTITLGSNDNFTITANGAATVRGNTGASVFVLNGQDTVLTRSASIDRVTVGSKAVVQVNSLSQRDVVGVGGGTLNYAAVDNSTGAVLSSNLSITGYAQLDRSNGGVAVITTQAGAATSITANASAQIVANGNDTIQAGAFVYTQTFGTAHLTFGAGGGYERLGGGTAATVTGGSGAVQVDDSYGSSLTFVGGTGTAQLTVGGGTANITAGRGNITLQGGASAATVRGGAGTEVINAGSGGTNVIVGSGATVFNCGAGKDVVEIMAGQQHGLTLVTGFNAATDRVQLDGYALGSARQTSFLGGTLLSLSDGTKVQFAGVSKLPGF